MSVYGKVGPATGRLIDFKVKVVDNMAELIDAIQKANVQALFKAAGLVRTTASRSIKRAPRYTKVKQQGRDALGRFTKAKWEKIPGRVRSKPGQPPYHHVDPGLRKLMKFDVEPAEMSAVVGPMKFAGAKGRDVPHVLEYGGTASNSKGRKYRLAARPYMKPAEEKARRVYPQFWKDSI